MIRSKGNLTGNRKLVLVILLGVPLALMAAKLSGLGGGFLSDGLSLLRVPGHMHDRVRYILFVPLGALVVVLTRLTLGIRVLGPFRSILLAIAFQITGILPGLIFLALVIAVICVVRPVLKAIRIPYFGRVSVILSTVAAIMMTALIASTWLEAEVLLGVAYFPIVVLCLAGDGFARTLVKEGARSALWRGAMTALVAILITLMADIPGFETFMLRFPEILFLEIGLIIAIAEYFDFRLLQDLNPKAKERRKATRKSGKASKTVGSSGGNGKEKTASEGKGESVKKESTRKKKSPGKGKRMLTGEPEVETVASGKG